MEAAVSKKRMTLLVKMGVVAAMGCVLSGCTLLCEIADVLSVQGGGVSSSDRIGNPSVLPTPLGFFSTCPTSVTEISDIPSGDMASEVEAAPTALPKAPPPSQPVQTPIPPSAIDCTDPANAGRGPCAGTNRQNKPLWKK
jgi:hypothetical protein